MTVYVTRYWSTVGVTEEDGVEVSDGYARRETRFCSSPRYLFAKMGSDAFEELSDAEAYVRKSAQRKAKTMRAKLEKLEEIARGGAIPLTRAAMARKER